jgi:hypothetical protein
MMVYLYFKHIMKTRIYNRFSQSLVFFVALQMFGSCRFLSMRKSENFVEQL